MTASMENLAWYAINHRIASQQNAYKALAALEEYVSQLCIAAGEEWREEWSEVCNDNQILQNTVVRLRTALLDTARRVEALKRECGMDPESAQAIRNSEYMSISLNARAAIDTA